MELMAHAQMHAQYSLGLSGQQSSDSDTFSRLGFGAGFDGLQALIKGDGIGNSDAFSQLAEAAMLDPRRRMFDPNESQLADTPVVRQNDSLRTDARQPLQQISRQPMAKSVCAGYPRSANSAGLSEQQLALERERARAASVSNPMETSSTSSPFLAAAAAAARPRAATGSQANLSSADGWVQKTSQRGQTVFYNTHTGATSSQLPANVVVSQANATEASSSRLQPQPMLRGTSSSGQNSSADSPKDMYDSNHLGPTDRSGRTSLGNSGESRPSSANSSNTASSTTALRLFERPPATQPTARRIRSQCRNLGDCDSRMMKSTSSTFIAPPARSAGILQMPRPSSLSSQYHPSKSVAEAVSRALSWKRRPKQRWT